MPELLGDSTWLLGEQGGELADMLYGGGPSFERSDQPLQATGYSQRDLYNPLARDSAGNVLTPGEPEPVSAPVAPPRMGAPLIQGGVRRMSPEEVAAGNAAAAKQEAIFNLDKQYAEQARRDREMTSQLLANTRVQDAQEAVDAAIRFQGMRSFEHDLERGVASGLSREQASIQALTKNFSRMFNKMAGPQSVVSGRMIPQVTRPPEWTTSPSGQNVNVGGRVQFEPTPKKDESEVGMPTGASRELAYVSRRIKELTPDMLSTPLTPEEEKELSGLKRLRAELEAKYGVNAMPAAAPTSTTVSVPAAGPVLRFRKDPKTGKAIRY